MIGGWQNYRHRAVTLPLFVFQFPHPSFLESLSNLSVVLFFSLNERESSKRCRCGDRFSLEGRLRSPNPSRNSEPSTPSSPDPILRCGPDSSTMTTFPTTRSPMARSPACRKSSGKPPHAASRGLQCYRSCSGRSSGEWKPARIGGLLAKTSCLAPVCASGGEILLERSWGFGMVVARSLSLLASNRFSFCFCYSYFLFIFVLRIRHVFGWSYPVLVRLVYYRSLLFPFVSYCENFWFFFVLCLQITVCSFHFSFVNLRIVFLFYEFQLVILRFSHFFTIWFCSTNWFGSSWLPRKQRNQKKRKSSLVLIWKYKSSWIVVGQLFSMVPNSEESEVIIFGLHGASRLFDWWSWNSCDKDVHVR